VKILVVEFGHLVHEGNGVGVALVIAPGIGLHDAYLADLSNEAGRVGDEAPDLIRDLGVGEDGLSARDVCNIQSHDVGVGVLVAAVKDEHAFLGVEIVPNQFDLIG